MGGRSEQSGVEIMAGLLLEAGENRDQGSKLLLLHYYAGEHQESRAARCTPNQTKWIMAKWADVITAPDRSL